MLEIADFARTQLANLLISLKRLSRMSGIADFAKHHPRCQNQFDSHTCSPLSILSGTGTAHTFQRCFYFEADNVVCCKTCQVLRLKLLQRLSSNIACSILKSYHGP